MMLVCREADGPIYRCLAALDPDGASVIMLDTP
jgi:hypothetical protein